MQITKEQNKPSTLLFLFLSFTAPTWIFSFIYTFVCSFLCPFFLEMCYMRVHTEQLQDAVYVTPALSGQIYPELQRDGTTRLMTHLLPPPCASFAVAVFIPGAALAHHCTKITFSWPATLTDSGRYRARTISRPLFRRWWMLITVQYIVPMSDCLQYPKFQWIIPFLVTAIWIKKKQNQARQ